MLEAAQGDRQGRLEMAVRTDTEAGDVVALGRHLKGGEKHAEAVGHQPVAFHHGKEILASEQVRLAQQIRKTTVQLRPLRKAQADLQVAFPQTHGHLHDLLRERSDMLHEVGSTPFGRHVLPDGTRTAGVEQQAAHQPVFGIGYQAGELPRRTRQQEGDGGTVDDDHLVVAFARRRHRFVVERLAEDVVKLPEVLLRRRDQRVDLAIHDQQARLAVVAQVDDQLRLRHLARHD